MDLAWIESQFPSLSNITPLAKGGQKIVLSACHADEGDVVLKLLLRAAGEERLEREVLAAELLECPRVPKIYETSSLKTPLGPCIWLREQRVAGTTLRTVLQAGPLGMASVLTLARQLLEALWVAEQRRIVHRDIKPENVMLDGCGDYWLLDFGLSRHLDLESLTASENPFGVGTVGYSAPEQMKNRKREIDARADLFALGVLLFECATGSNPFYDGARDKMEVLGRVETQALPPLSVPYDRNGALRDFVSALTQKYPSQRPDTIRQAKEWFDDVDSALNGQDTGA